MLSRRQGKPFGNLKGTRKTLAYNYPLLLTARDGEGLEDETEEEQKPELGTKAATSAGPRESFLKREIGGASVGVCG